jgi:hypothetical protein
MKEVGRSIPKTKYGKAHEEHKQLKNLLTEPSDTASGNESNDAELTVFTENADHRVHEGKTEMFPERRKFSKDSHLAIWAFCYNSIVSSYKKHRLIQARERARRITVHI